MDYYISLSTDNQPWSTSFSDKKVEFKDLHLYTSRYHYSNISFRNGKRKGDNFQGCSLLMFDIDNGYTIPEMIEKLGDTTALIVTTRTHRLSMKNGKAISPTDRYRLILPLDKPIRDPKEYKQVVSTLIKEFRADTACVDTGRFYYAFPGQEVYYVN